MPFGRTCNLLRKIPQTKLQLLINHHTISANSEPDLDGGQREHQPVNQYSLASTKGRARRQKSSAGDRCTPGQGFFLLIAAWALLHQVPHVGEQRTSRVVLSPNLLHPKQHYTQPIPAHLVLIRKLVPRINRAMSNQPLFLSSSC